MTVEENPDLVSITLGITYQELVDQSAGILTTKMGIPILFPSYDRAQLIEVIQSDAYQFEEFKTAFNYLKSSGQLNGNIFVDVGANVGTHTIYALREPEIRAAIAVEASSVNAAFLRMNLALNEMSAKTRIVHAAVCDFSGEIEIIKNPSNCGDNRLAKRGASNYEGHFVSENSKAMTLDELLASYSVEKTAMLWMDTQGSEGLILGTSERIKATAFPIYIEFWPEGLDRLNSFGLLKKFIMDNVRRIVRFTGGSAREYDLSQVDEIYNELKTAKTFCDLLLIREAR